MCAAVIACPRSAQRCHPSRRPVCRLVAEIGFSTTFAGFALRTSQNGCKMVCVQKYASPVGGMLLAADEIGLTGLWFEGEKFFADNLPAKHEEKESPTLAAAKRWLDIYFKGKEPDFTPPLHPVGSAFRMKVWDILLQIPYGQTVTYGWIARQLAAQEGLARMSAQAVGGAVGHNEISIIIPCHRVVGTSGSLTGYAGGLDRKIALLKTEHVDMSRFFVPKKGTAL